ncbi:hypothetical protein CONPUDRAFT_108693 [Coniophora puteana RWD-64-598 SS2]|uniref:Uncharacterized protein n=1 Tax=Coniophora puteana (strain RWD-64-598) TaxID=741705 RepID=A0A5M3MHY0_CONPW|nr:uncharacterized protein CONPUDRAFT_108693 [Coniophora puteana RWD-64-598 SS2]EIW78703.1 hypothetical protein CONPUDRAFT_108693 [Coniophora puteana RWD-64-598 SS2]
MDAKPTMRLLNFILLHVAVPSAGPAIGVWGDEWRNLPVGTMTVTGGTRDDWDTRGMALQKEIADIRASTVASDDAISFSVTYLFDAAIALSISKAVQSSSTSIPEDTYVTIDPALIGQDRFRTPQYNNVGQLATGVCWVPIKIPIKVGEEKNAERDQLIHMLTAIQEQYSHFVSNPNLPHLNAAETGGMNPEALLRVVGENKKPTSTNIGRVEDVIKADPKLVKPLSLAIGHRITWKQP